MPISTRRRMRNLPPPGPWLARMRQRTTRISFLTLGLGLLAAAFLIFVVCACQTFR